MADIHPTALVANGANLHPSVQVGPFCIIEDGAVLGADCVLDSNVRIYGATRMGRGNRVCHGATIGSEPQDLTYTPAKSRPLIIGNDNHFKECVNISRGVKTEQGTRIGNNNYFMAFSHVGHDCLVEDATILGHTAGLSGHVELAHHALVAGQTAIHQFCRIGAYVMIGGVTGVAQDVPPYVMVNGQRAQIISLNTVGLRRNGFTPAQRIAIQRAYRIIYRSGLNRTQALAQLQAIPDSPETQAIVEFFTARSQRGHVGWARPHRAHAEMPKD
jgi:UDP-N-acetylglucosamine acyltransferase